MRVYGLWGMPAPAACGHKLRDVVSVTRRSSGVAPRACVCVRVRRACSCAVCWCWCRRIFTHIHTYMHIEI